MISEARKRANRKWDAEHMATIGSRVKTEEAEKIRAAASAAGQSVSAYILQAVRERIDKETGEG